MADTPDKPQPVQIKRPSTSIERTNDIRINKDAAQRIIARYLRDHAKMLSGPANDLSTRICDGLHAAMPETVRPALRGFRMIGEYPVESNSAQIAGAIRAIDLKASNWTVAQNAWAVVYYYGNAIPDDVTV